ncbi:hypothetical protein GWI33_018901 [Rhynchophorus ferrugineus]|uniref:Uncharacterized protein n=1 Tax=Rhynchophorus ferrugineus TaxID=354439 RepID=A0A834HUV9_RHYFE|nr:hypothetical protein GWI33_018901 [Rhynchophorus ferrugineus]
MDDGKKHSGGLTIDRAAFLILRVKKAFKKKKLQRKERERKNWKRLLRRELWWGRNGSGGILDIRHDKFCSNFSS